MSNRRIWPRVTTQVLIEGGYTLNVSLRGARIVTRQSVRPGSRLRMQFDETVEIAVEPVWEQPLGSHNRVVGLRFLPDEHQEAVIYAWMKRQAS